MDDIWQTVEDRAKAEVQKHKKKDEKQKKIALLLPKFSKNYLTLLEKFKSQADFVKNGKKLLDFLLHALYN